MSKFPDLEDREEWSRKDLDELITRAHNEKTRRDRIERVEKTSTSIIKEWQDAQGRKDGDPWVQPDGYLSAYFKDATVTHKDKTWISNIDQNVYEPGVRGWYELVPEGSPPPEFVQPSGYEDAYPSGRRVTFKGKVYESTHDQNVWSPEEAPEHWTLIEEESGEDPEDPDEDLEEQIEEWEQRYSHNPYQKGDRVLWTDGKVYESNIDGNTWSPADAPNRWDLVTLSDK